MIYTEKQINEIAKSLAEEKNIRVHKRLQIVSWKMIGKTNEQIMELSGFCRSSVYNVLNNYKYGGLDFLKDAYVGGGARKIPLHTEKQILDSLLGKAKEGNFLRGAELQQAFEEKAGVKYNANNFYKVVNRHGWRKQMPRSRHPKKASDEAIEASKKLTQITWI